jgi:hypothetical protein
MTTMPAYDAANLGMPIPAQPANIKHEQTGLEVRSGYLRCQIVGMDQTEYAFPCFFLGDPTAPPDPIAPPATLPRYLLGLSGVIDKIRLLFDGEPGPGAPHGYLIVEKKVASVKSAWRRVLGKGGTSGPEEETCGRRIGGVRETRAERAERRIVRRYVGAICRS